MNNRHLCTIALSFALLTACSNKPESQNQEIALPGQTSANSTEGTQSTPLPSADYPKVALQTSRGTIVIALFDDKAPASVRNFIGYVESGHYNNTVFHRVIDNLLIQGGGYNTQYQLKPERNWIQSEASGMRNLRGTVATARRSNDTKSVGAQFFINVVDNPQFDSNGAANSGYTVFGQVVEGMHILDALRAEPVITRANVGEHSPKNALVVQTAQLLK